MEAPGVKYLLDTALWINAVTLPHLIPRRIRLLLETDQMKGLCSVSLLEAAILHRLRRMIFQGTLLEFFAAGLSSDLQLLELTPTIAARTNELPDDFHGDPFDRTIVATAATLNLTLITADPFIRDAKACTVEFYPFQPGRRTGV